MKKISKLKLVKTRIRRLLISLKIVKPSAKDLADEIFIKKVKDFGDKYKKT